MAKIAIIETKPSRNNYQELFDGEFEFDLYQLCSDSSVKKVLKKDVDIDIDLDAYDWVILVGVEPLKYFTKLNSVSAYSGQKVQDKFLPVINPAMLRFKPEAQRHWLDSKEKIVLRVQGKLTEDGIETLDLLGIEDEKEAIDYIQKAIDADSSFIALDSETSAFYPRDGYVLGLSITYKDKCGAYISSECISEEVEKLLQKLFNKKEVVFHNAKFDLGFFEYHFNFKFPRFHDTMLLHYILDETQGTHGLKQLAMKFTDYGDYEVELEKWKKDYCKRTGTKVSEFSYEVIPFEVIAPYAAIDTVVTWELFKKFYPLVMKNDRFRFVYEHILIPGTRFLTDVQDNGVPFCPERLNIAKKIMGSEIVQAVEALNKFPEVNRFIEDNGAFNPNSPSQLRRLLFDYIGLPPTGVKTGTGADSTNAEVLKELSELHEVPKHILKLRKSSKIKNTYIDKIIPQLNKDNRLRTGFSLHTTTSGRLSSSGKLNMQQLPRDNPLVKGCIKAREGYKIVSLDW